MNYWHKQLDLVIEYQIDETTGNLIAHKFQQSGVPIIAVDIPMVGGVYFGVNNYHAGKMAGVELGNAIQERWQGQVDRVILMEQHRAGSLPAMRINGQIEGLRDIIPNITNEQIISVDFDNTSKHGFEVMQSMLAEIDDNAHIAIICFNDDAAIGALDAARQVDFTDNLLLVSQGADRRLRTEMRKPGSPIVGATAYRPEDYGSYLIQLALDILSGKQVSPAVYMEHYFIKPQNVDEFYNDAGGES